MPTDTTIAVGTRVRVLRCLFPERFPEHNGMLGVVTGAAAENFGMDYTVRLDSGEGCWATDVELIREGEGT